MLLDESGLMKVLVIGKGGREHALLWRLNQSETARKLYCAGGNPGIAQLAKIVPVAQNDFAGLADFVRKETIDLTVVGPEDPLAAGIVDEFDRAGLRIFGPTRAAAQLEASKAFAKAVMREAGVPTASFEVFDEADAARRWVRAHSGPMVVKADGLALGKGVVVCEDAAVRADRDRRRDGAQAFRRGGRAGRDRRAARGRGAFVLRALRRRKRGRARLGAGSQGCFDGDRGPNTGGMGAYTPVPHFGAALEARVMDEVVAPTLGAMRARGTPFRGVMFVGLMVDGDRINVLEYNVRFGDPECEPLMMRFEGDLAETLLACAEGRLKNLKHQAFAARRGCGGAGLGRISGRVSQGRRDKRT